MTQHPGDDYKFRVELAKRWIDEGVPLREIETRFDLMDAQQWSDFVQLNNAREERTCLTIASD